MVHRIVALWVTYSNKEKVEHKVEEDRVTAISYSYVPTMQIIEIRLEYNDGSVWEQILPVASVFQLVAYKQEVL